MRKFIKLFCIVAILAIIAPQSADAQFFKKLKDTAKGVLDDATSSSSSSSSSTSSSPATSTVQARDFTPTTWGGTMYNPISSVLDVELVECYGKSISVNFGKVYFKLKVKLNIVDDFVKIQEFNTLAIDQDGNSYAPLRSHSQEIKVTEGIWVNIESDSEMCFQNVKKTATSFQTLKMRFWFRGRGYNGDNTGVIEFRDVPIKWMK